MTWRAGDRLGRYEIDTVIGRGSMGVVYRANDPTIARLVAIKAVLLTEEDTSDEHQRYRERFFTEARAAGKLSHPAIVTIYDVGETDDKLPFIVMEYVAGQSLKQILAKEKKLPLGTALRITREVAEALDYAHAQGVVHRDIKPANILLSSDGAPKITDFGIAKLNQSHLTLPGQVIGSPAFMAPEQLEGEEVDGRADLFSLGVILYNMISGHRPFQGNSATTVCFKVANHHPLPLRAFDPNLPPELNEIVSRAVAKNPADRYQTGIEFAFDIEQLREKHSSGEPTCDVASMVRRADQATARAQAEDLTINRRRHFWLHTNLGMAIFALAFATILFTLSIRRSLFSAGVQDFAAPLAPPHAAAPPAFVTNANVSTSAAPRAEAVRSVASRQIRSSALKPKETAHNIVAEGTYAKLLVNIEHQFRDAHASIWIDNQLVYQRTLQGRAKSHALIFRRTAGSQSDSVTVPAGTHDMRVHVQAPADGYDENRTLTVRLLARSNETLRVLCDKKNHRLQIETQ